jgi:hydrogenase maturation protein HypF
VPTANPNFEIGMHSILTGGAAKRVHELAGGFNPQWILLERRKIQITGAVQGVGFRPFIFNLASRLGVTGYVANTSQGVTIEAQADSNILDQFVKSIISQRPRLAQPEITDIHSIPVDSQEVTFTIQNSLIDQAKRSAITPDAATCVDCLHELLNPSDRRFRYPFINCTHCGPRYTIIFDIPYDRPNTTMRVFDMCPSCKMEYANPADRRFHAQPNACPACGPHVWLTDSQDQKVESDDPILKTIELLEQEHIVAIKGLGGFHLATRADCDAAVTALRERKYRKAKAFAIMVRDIDTARQFAEIDEAAEDLLTDIECPIVLCPKKNDRNLSESVAPGSRFWGMMLPYTPLHALLMQGDFPALVMTSGNNTDEIIESENKSALKRLGGIADFFLLHNRDIYTSCDDSVAKIFRRKPMLLRRARGYVPLPIRLARQSQTDILAVGAELKNTITYLKGNEAYVSQHIGDLKGTATYDSFLRTIEKLGALIDCRPKVVACDMHPAMLSSRFAQTYQDVQLIPVQHHHAHLAAVMGEHDLSGPVVGIVADGLGYGTDETIWGCELLATWRDRFERKGFLQPVPMPGGDAAGREPWRMAVSFLIHTFGPEEGSMLAQSLLKDIEPDKIKTVADMCVKKTNSSLTSSLGRLCDAVSALLGICLTNTYDAQAPIELENNVDPEIQEDYPIKMADQETHRILRVNTMIEAIVSDIESGADKGGIAAKFHNSLVTAMAQWGAELALELNTNIVAISGGAFQNDILLYRLVERLKTVGLNVYYNQKLPVNDGCISFGQAVVADATRGKL